MHNHLPAMALRLLLITSTLTYACCMQQPKPPQQGDVVLWMHNPQLIIKAKLGQRREHIVDTHCPACERDFYRPEQERYVGQFAIDFVPKKYPPISPAEAAALPPLYSSHPLEFNLMLNGSTAKATDEGLHGPRAQDHPDQVKVEVSYARKTVDGSPNLNTKDFFYTHLLKDRGSESDLDISSKYARNGLTCYSFKDQVDLGRCFSPSQNTQVSGFHVFYVAAYEDTKGYVQGEVNEHDYLGGINVIWLTNPKNIVHAQQIDAAIWRLLTAWNVAPAKQ